MQKWEYCTLQLGGLRIGQEKKVILQSDGKHKEEPISLSRNAGERIPQLNILIAQLGEDGWEFCTAENGYWYFKRPIEG